MDNLGQKAIDLHRQHHGKLETVAKLRVDTPEDLALVYTPHVGEVVKAIANDPAQARELTIKRNTIAVVSDGSAILGFGDLGPLAALPVMEGKAVLFKELAGIDAFPICLDTKDPDEIVATVKRIAPAFGGINLEDIAAPKCFEIERRLRAELNIPVIHDDQHGTAVVVLAGLINACKLRGFDPAYVRLVMVGAGAAGTAVVKLLTAYGFKNILVCDSKGIISSQRGDLDVSKKEILQITNPDDLSGDVQVACRGAEIFVGLSKGGLMTPEMVSSMADRPVIFALANPEPEILPDAAKRAGAYIVATGRSDFPNQINNALAYPGIFRGLLDSGKAQVGQSDLLAAAVALAGSVGEATPDHLLPGVLDRGAVLAVAAAVMGQKEVLAV